MTQVLEKVQTMKENPLWSDVPGIVTNKIDQAQIELEHILRHAQGRKEQPAKSLKFTIAEVDEGIARANLALASLRRFYATLSKA